MNKSFTIPGELTDLNTYIYAERSNKYIAASLKMKMTQICSLYARGLGHIDGRVKVGITWYCKNQKIDPDNLSFAKKFVIDGLVAAGVIDNDGWKNILGFEDRFEVDKVNPRVEIMLIGE